MNTLFSSPQSPSMVALTELATAIYSCSACGLCSSRKNAVPGTGPAPADVMIIGEAPGKKEDETGIPFCGASGKILDALLKSIGLDRDLVYITNIVKCRPPENRDPLPEEKDVCSTLYLYKQIAIVQPKVILTLGRHALSFFDDSAPISELHGTPIVKDSYTLLPLYHPAASIYNQHLRQTLFEDFAQIPNLLAKHS